MHAPLIVTRDSDVFSAGDVRIHPGAAVASGVILQADLGATIVVESGACIGLGCVLHAHAGIIRVAEGAILGTEVLLVGSLTVGAKACIGAGSTVMNTAMLGAQSLTIADGEVIAPGSILTEYETTTQISYSATPPKQPFASESAAFMGSEAFEASTPTPAIPPTDLWEGDPWGEEAPAYSSETVVPPPPEAAQVRPPVEQGAEFMDELGVVSSGSDLASQPMSPALNSGNANPEISAEIPAETKLGATAIYGKVRLNKLLVTLLPHRQYSDPGNPAAFDQD